MDNLHENKVYEFEEFRLDAAHLLLYHKNQEVSLAPRAIETLLALLERPGEVVSKDELMDAIWTDTIVEESNLWQYLHLLRKTLGKHRDGRPFIETLKRRGYRFNGDVTVMEIENRHLPQRQRKAEEIKTPVDGGLGTVNLDQRPLRVQKRGNVLALADWRDEPALRDFEPIHVSGEPKAGWFVSRTMAIVAIVTVGAAILFAAYRFTGESTPPEENLVSTPFAEMAFSRLTTGGKTKHAAISPDGKYVAHVTADSEGNSLWVRHISAPTNLRVAGPAKTEYVSVTFAVNGDSVYYLTLDPDKGHTALYRVPVLGGPSTMAAYDVGPVGFSPDERQIAFIKMDGDASRLVVASVDGSNERTVATRPPPELFRMYWNAPAWSPDGKTIAAQVRLNDERGPYETVVGVNVDDGSQRPLTTARWSYAGQSVWLANGEGLLVTATESTSAPAQVWYIALTGGEAKRITNDMNDYHDLSLTADSSRMAVVQDHTVSFISVATDGDNERSKQIASDTGWITEMAWTPDGRLVYRSNAGGAADIWVMNADGSNPKQLTTGARASGGLAVSPDGQYIFFASDRAGHFNIWRVDADGGNLRHLTAGNDEFYPQATPDGRWVVFQRGVMEPRLWKVPVDGGEPIQLTESRAVRPAVSPDGELIAYYYLDPDVNMSRWRIGIVSSAGGRRLRQYDFPATVTPSQRFVRWSPDGRSIAFPNSPGGLSDIWAQPLDGSPAIQLTDFKAERIIAFEWSTDASTLAIVRGVETSDVVLINNSVSK